MRQVGTGKTLRSPRFSGIAVDVSLLNNVASKPGCSRSARDESGGCPLFWPGGVRHVGDVSPVCCFCAERGKARLDTAVEDGEGSCRAAATVKALDTLHDGLAGHGVGEGGLQHREPAV